MDRYAEEALEKGIESVLREMERSMAKPLSVWRMAKCVWPMISDGRIHDRGLPYWLPRFRTEEYYYRQKDELLYLCYGKKDGNIVEIAEVKKEELADILNVVELRREALDFYDLIASQADFINDEFEQELIGTLLHSSAKIQEIFDLYGIRLSMERPSRIVLARFTASVSNMEKSSAHWMKKLADFHRKEASSPIIWEDRILWNVSVEVSRDELEEFLGGEDPVVRDDALTLIWGIGGVYDWHELHRSYLEANIAWGLNVLRKEENPCFFEKLGTEQLLFAQSLPALREYIHQNFDILWEHDCQNNQQLFTTLQKLVRNDFSITKAAQQMDLHVNTVRYRAGKIEELLQIQLDSYHTRANLIASLTVWEVLDMIGFMDIKETGAQY